MIQTAAFFSLGLVEQAFELLAGVANVANQLTRLASSLAR